MGGRAYTIPLLIRATDAEARDLLYGNLNTASFVTEYERLRDSGMGMEQALVFTGHEFRLRQLAYRAAR
jgi:hypothetical protein